MPSDFLHNHPEFTDLTVERGERFDDIPRYRGGARPGREE
jgi:hypothetical protein